MLVFLFIIFTIFVLFGQGKSGVPLILAAAGALLFFSEQWVALLTLIGLVVLQQLWKTALEEPDSGSDLDPRQYRVIEPSQSRVWRTRGWLMGGTLIVHGLVGAACLILTVVSSFQPVISEAWWFTTLTWGIALLALGPGTILFYDQFMLAREKLRHPPLFEGIERATLQIALQHGFKLNAGELAMDTLLTLEQSAEILRHFEARQLASSQVSGDGTLLYDFHACHKSTLTQ